MATDRKDLDNLIYVSPRSWDRVAVDDANFAYESSRAKARFAHLMKAEDYKSLIDNQADDIEWIGHWAREFNAANYDVKDTVIDTLTKGYSDNDRLLIELCGGEKEDFAKMFILKNDYHNAKVIAKNFLLGQLNAQDAKRVLRVNESLFQEAANVEIESLVQWVLSYLNKDKSNSVLPDLHEKYFSMALERLLEEDAKTNEIDLAAVDINLDKAYYLHFLELVAEDKHKGYRDLLLDYISIQSDSSNLQSFYRCKKRKLTLEEFKRQFVAAGRIEFTDFAEKYQLDDEKINLGLKFNAKGSLVDSLLNLAESSSITEFLNEFTQVRDNLLIRLADKAEGLIYGAEVLFALWQANRVEITNLQLIHAAHQLGRSEEMTAKRLRDIYGGQLRV